MWVEMVQDCCTRMLCKSGGSRGVDNGVGGGDDGGVGGDGGGGGDCILMSENGSHCRDRPLRPRHHRDRGLRMCRHKSQRAPKRDASGVERLRESDTGGWRCESESAWLG